MTQKKRFIYKYKKNKGLADTKKVGIELAHGKYISVIDSDDTISEEFYNNARKAISEGYDIIIYDLYIVFEDTKKTNYTTRAIREDSEGELLNKLMHGAMLGSSCNKIIKKDLYKYPFPLGQQYEDVAVTPFILCDSKKIKYIPNPNYYYLQRKNSIVNNNTLDNAFYKICKNLSNVFNNIENKNKYSNIINIFFVERTLDMFDLTLINNRRKFCIKMKEFYNDNCDIIKYIIDNDIIYKYDMFSTKNQKKVISMIYNNLYNKKFFKIKMLLKFRRYIRWNRAMYGTFKIFIKCVIGGIYG